MIEDHAAREAVKTLGLLKLEAIPTIVRLLDGTMSEHPRSITTRYRKEGPQVSDEEKKALGIRKNGFLSRTALTEITPLGIDTPLTAHETTLLRATFSVMRHRRVVEGEKARESLGGVFEGYLHETLHRDCPACNRLNGKVTDAANADIIPPTDCVAGCFANYGIRIKIDWLAGVE